MLTFLVGFFSKEVSGTAEEWAKMVIVECAIEFCLIVAVVMLIANGGA